MPRNAQQVGELNKITLAKTFSFNFKDQNIESKEQKGYNLERPDFDFKSQQVVISASKRQQRKGNNMNMPSNAVINLNHANVA